jgi:23S rRNA (cytidine1920-2'-O)/16S rRNA (cytidine1409-2'-O)-methyltransferase
LSTKERLDILLVERKEAESREKAKTMIMEGIVFVNNQRVDKPGTLIPKDAVILVKGKKLQYVSRGGLKLEKAIKEFGIDLKEKKCMDIGASTGGFSDCMLQNGASFVYAVDVGYGQLAWSIRNNEKVKVLERTNARYLTREQIPDIIDFSSIDVSFISLKLILPPVRELLRDNGNIVALIKPQFEAGREKVGKNGVVRDSNVHIEVIREIIGFSASNGFNIKGLTFSPIKGPEGNIEYLLFLEKSSDNELSKTVDVEKTVNDSHMQLDIKK